MGKTTVTANLGYALSLGEARTVMLDGDIGLNNLDVVTDAEDLILYDIGDVAKGKANIDQALIELNKDLFLMPSITACSAFVTEEIFIDICYELAQKFDYLLIDSPAGVEDSFLRAAGGARESVIVSTPHLASVRDGYKTARILSDLGFERQGLVINRIRGDFVADKVMLDASEIAGAVKLPLYGVLPEDDKINVGNIADFDDKRSSSAYSYRLIADYITGKDKRIYDYLSPYRGLGGLLRRRIR